MGLNKTRIYGMSGARCRYEDTSDRSVHCKVKKKYKGIKIRVWSTGLNPLINRFDTQ